METNMRRMNSNCVELGSKSLDRLDWRMLVGGLCSITSKRRKYLCQFSNHETRNYIILAFIIIGLLIWLISVLIIGFVCYRRRHNRKVSVRKRSVIFLEIDLFSQEDGTICLLPFYKSFIQTLHF
ncbi:unnamed protein product [Schistosoma intercalatum]|nr:unnamed protein product [Schistosoma intercalatum]